jgi:hypothetical protein
MTFAAPLPSIDISTNDDVCSDPVKAGREAGWDGDARRDQGGGRAEVVRLSESDSSLSSDEARLDAAAAHATLQEVRVMAVTCALKGDAARVCRTAFIRAGLKSSPQHC